VAAAVLTFAVVRNLYKMWRISRLSRRIASGHAFDKHVVKKNEFSNILKCPTKEEFKKHVRHVMKHGKHKKFAGGKKEAWYDKNSNTIVIHDPANKDGGTAFRPHKGEQYFNDLK